WMSAACPRGGGLQTRLPSLMPAREPLRSGSRTAHRLASRSSRGEIRSRLPRRGRHHHGVPQQPLVTERLELVPLSDEHLDEEAALDADPGVMAFVGGRPRTIAEVAQAHERRMDRGRQVDGLGFWAGFVRTL